MSSHHKDARSDDSNAPPAEPSFRSEMERQLLEIQDAFAAFADKVERQKLEAETQLREAEPQKSDMEDRLQAVEKQRQETEDRLRKLQGTLAVRAIRFFRRLNPSRSARR